MKPSVTSAVMASSNRADRGSRTPLRVRAAGWWVGNVDVVVAAEQPRLAPHVAAMAANLVAALRAAAEPMGEGIHVSVKPKRGEGIGAIGRAATADTPLSAALAFVAMAFAGANVVGGYWVTDRMLQMFKRRPSPATDKNAQ